MKQRAKPRSIGRCCWVCGRPGGLGATIALELLGYEVPLLPGTPPQGDLPNQRAIGYAHPECLRREQAAAAATAREAPPASPTPQSGRGSCVDSPAAEKPTPEAGPVREPGPAGRPGPAGD